MPQWPVSSAAPPCGCHIPGKKPSLQSVIGNIFGATWGSLFLRARGTVPCQKTQTSWFMATFIGINDDSFLELGFPWFSHNFEVRNPDFLWICGLSWSHWRRKQQLRRPRRRQRVWPRCAGLWRTWGRMWWSLSYIYIYIIFILFICIIII